MSTEIDADMTDPYVGWIEANGRNTARTKQMLRELDAARLGTMTRAFITLYDALAEAPDHIRSLDLERLLVSLADARGEADRVINMVAPA